MATIEGRFELTKSGSCPPVREIRYFKGSRTAYMPGMDELIAFSRRVSLLLNTFGCSFGAWTHLHIFVVEGERTSFERIEDGFEDWHRYVQVGVPKGFSAFHEKERVELLKELTRSALRLSLPDRTGDVDRACVLAEAKGENLFFPIKSKKIGKSVLQAVFNVPVWPERSTLRVVLSDGGVSTQSLGTRLELYQDAYHLAGSIERDDEYITLVARSSFSSQVVAGRYGSPLKFRTADFEPVEGDVFISNALSGRI